MGLGCCRSHPSSVATETKDESCCIIRPNCDGVVCFFYLTALVVDKVCLSFHLFIYLHINTCMYRVNEKCTAKPTEGCIYITTQDKIIYERRLPAVWFPSYDLLKIRKKFQSVHL